MSQDPWLPGVHSAPNLQDHPELYEVENAAADPDGLVEAAIADLTPGWEGGVVVDVGCGTGYHLARLAARARHVVGIEPHARSRLLAMRRVAAAGLENVSVMAGSAERTLLASGMADLIVARFAYFFPPGCEPGIAEALRVTAPGGSMVVIDNDYSRSTFSRWVRESPWGPPMSDPEQLRQFWEGQGFELRQVLSEWRFGNLAERDAVLRIEFPPDYVDGLIAGHDGLSIDYGFALWHRRRE